LCAGCGRPLGGAVGAPRFWNESADRCRRGHVLGEAAVRLQTERPIFGAEIVSAEQAPAALTTGDAGARNDSIPHVESKDISSGFDHPADELVAKYHAWSTEDRAVIPLRRVSATDRGAYDLEYHLIGVGARRVCDFFDLYVAWPVKDRGPHVFNTRFGL
jgi:hypothetical protein